MTWLTVVTRAKTLALVTLSAASNYTGTFCVSVKMYVNTYWEETIKFTKATENRNGVLLFCTMTNKCTVTLQLTTSSLRMTQFCRNM
jgi:ABC-type sugar transport system substrate-binding protein